MKRKKTACLKKKIQNCCCIMYRTGKNSCPFQDYVYTIRVTLLNPLKKKSNERQIWQREKKNTKWPHIGCTVSESGLASGISQSESILR